MEYLSKLVHSLVNSPSFTLSNVTAVIGVVVGAISTVIAIWPLIKQRRTERLLEKSFGADFYDVVTIERATRYYIRPNCTSVDPASEAEMRQLISTEEDLFSTVARHLNQDTLHRHLLLLADSGMGKSSFVINYYAHNLNLRRRKRQRLAVVPLGIPNALEAIAQIDNKKETIIFLDAFDEDTEAIKDHARRLNDLMLACSGFKRVLITCRTQFFPSDEEIPKQTGIARVSPRLPGEAAVYEFWKLYLSPLNDEQVDRFIRKRYSIWRWRKRDQARALVSKIPFLSVRPMLLAYTPELLESRTTHFKYAFQVYEVMVRKWLERESGWIDPDLLLPFSENLAVNLFTNRTHRGAERISKTELADILKQETVRIDDWKITGRSLLNRDALGNLKFAHRSILEYLFVKRFATGEPGIRGVELTDNMKSFLLEMIHSACQEKDRAMPVYQKADLANAPHLRMSPINILRSRPKTIRDINQELNRMGYLSSGINFLHEHIYVPEKRNKTRLVVDYSSRLQWQTEGSNLPLFHSSAQHYIWRMNDFLYAGYSEWRLPTLAELLSMVGMSNGSLGLDPIFNPRIDAVWTSDFILDTGEAIAVFGQRAGLQGYQDLKVIQSVIINKIHLNICVIKKGSSAAAYVLAVRNLEPFVPEDMLASAVIV